MSKVHCCRDFATANRFSVCDFFSQTHKNGHTTGKSFSIIFSENKALPFVSIGWLFFTIFSWQSFIAIDISISACWSEDLMQLTKWVPMYHYRTFLEVKSFPFYANGKRSRKRLLFVKSISTASNLNNCLINGPDSAFTFHLDKETNTLHWFSSIQTEIDVLIWKFKAAIPTEWKPTVVDFNSRYADCDWFHKIGCSSLELIPMWFFLN